MWGQDLRRHCRYFAAANQAELAQIVDLPHGAPSHDSFSRLFRLLDPEEMTEAFARFQTALRAELGLPPAKGVVAVDGKSLRRGYERGRSFMPPLMISVWDAETRLSLASRHAPGGDEVAATLYGAKVIRVALRDPKQTQTQSADDATRLKSPQHPKKSAHRPVKQRVQTANRPLQTVNN